MRKTKIMAVAPYEGLRDLLLQTAKIRDDIDISVFLGNASQTVEYVEAAGNMGYSVIMACEGTSENIERITPIPVIGITVSGFEVMRAIRLADNHSGPFAIVGCASVANIAKELCGLMQNKIDVYAVNSDEETDACLAGLKSNGFTLIVGDAPAVSRARDFGFGAILIASSPESVKLSLERAVKLDKIIRLSNKQESLYKNILGEISQNVAVFHSSGSAVFSNFSRDGDPSLEFGALKKYIPDVIKKQRLSVSIRRENSLWLMKASKISHSNEDYALFCMEREYDKYDSSLIKFLNYDELIPDPLETFYRASDIASNPMLKAAICGDNPRPTLIRGEPGAGKEAIAKTIHLRSAFKDGPMALIDCRMINNKNWDATINGKNSIMSLRGCTIYLKNIQSMTMDIQKKVGACFVKTPLSRNNRLIFSHTDRSPFTVDNSFCEYLLGVFGCVTINIPPLRERRGDIPSLTSLYIGEANQKFATQILGFEKNAMEKMMRFSWPTNTAQLKRVLNELLMLPNTYIKEDDVDLALENESRIHGMSSSSVEIPLDGSLDDIVSSVISSVLAAENMNQTKTAKRLGISRGTLWKKLRHI